MLRRSRRRGLALRELISARQSTELPPPALGFLETGCPRAGLLDKEGRQRCGAAAIQFPAQRHGARLWRRLCDSVRAVPVPLACVQQRAPWPMGCWRVRAKLRALPHTVRDSEETPARPGDCTRETLCMRPTQTLPGIAWKQTSSGPEIDTTWRATEGCERGASRIGREFFRRGNNYLPAPSFSEIPESLLRCGRCEAIGVRGGDVHE